MIVADFRFIIKLICLYVCFSFYEVQPYPGVYAEHCHEGGLHGVDYQHEEECAVFCHAVEYEHRLYGEMPWSGTVGRRHDDGYAAYHERYEGAPQTERLGVVEAEEREVVVQEIACPDAERQRYEQWHVADVAQRDDALPQPAGGVFQALVYRHAAQQHVDERACHYGADYRYCPSGCRKLSEHDVHARARLREEVGEYGQLCHDGKGGNDEHEQRVDSPLGNNRAECLRKRHAVPALQHSATCKLAYAGHDEADGIRQEYGVDGYAATRLLAHRLQCLLPAPATKQLCRDAEGKRQEHPRPVHAIEKCMPQLGKVEVAVHPVEYRSAESQRQYYLQRACYAMTRVCHRMLNFSTAKLRKKRQCHKLLLRFLLIGSQLFIFSGCFPANSTKYLLSVPTDSAIYLPMSFH